MSATEEKPPVQFKLPFTFGGVANYARAGWKRLLLVELAFAAIASACVTLTAHLVWLPAVDHAVRQLPDGAALQAGKLRWPAREPAFLHESPFVAIAVDPSGENTIGQAADVQLELEPDGCQITSLFGYRTLDYPAGNFALNRAQLQPRWEAWRPMVLGGVAIGTVTGLLLAWAALGLLHWPLAKLTAFYGDREGDWRALWRVSCAALMPGALLMSGAVLLYGLGRLNLISLLFAWVLHLLIGWIYVAGAPVRLKRREATGVVPTGKNPFVSTAGEAGRPPAGRDDNPFR